MRVLSRSRSVRRGVSLAVVVAAHESTATQSASKLTELYRAARLYVNFFQPSMKLLSKQRDGARLVRKYDQAQTPFQRLVASEVLIAEQRARLETIFAALDPLQLLQQLQTLQEALWKHAVFRAPAASNPSPHAPSATLAFDAQGCLQASDPTDTLVDRVGPDGGGTASPALPLQTGKRKYHRSKHAVPHTWRTRPDRFEGVWEEVCDWLRATPERMAKSLFVELQQLDLADLILAHEQRAGAVGAKEPLLARAGVDINAQVVDLRRHHPARLGRVADDQRPDAVGQIRDLLLRIMNLPNEARSLSRVTARPAQQQHRRPGAACPTRPSA